MTKTENVINGIEACLQETYEVCKACPYHVFYPNGCVIERNRDVLELLKEKEPRVMTLEEVKNAEIVWIEQVEHCVPAIKIRTFEDCKMMFAYSYDDNIHTINIVPKYYNRISRCWTSRPTYEQRKAVKWDD